MIGRGPLTVRDLRELGVPLHKHLGIEVEDRLVATTDSMREIRVLYAADRDRLYPRDGETEFINAHLFRYHVSLARVA